MVLYKRPYKRPHLRARFFVILIGENCTAIADWNTTLGRFVIHPAGSDLSNFNMEYHDPEL